jgi:hypothetical protein
VGWDLCIRAWAGGVAGQLAEGLSCGATAAVGGRRREPSSPGPGVPKLG